MWKRNGVIRTPVTHVLSYGIEIPFILQPFDRWINDMHIHFLLEIHCKLQ